MITKVLASVLPVKIKVIISGIKNRFIRERIIKKWIASGSHIPPPHAVKQSIIEGYKGRFGYTIFIETGTYKGNMVYAQLGNFDTIYSIELDVELFLIAEKKFARNKNVKILQGDSAKCLIEITKALHEPAIFWLDGHYMGNDGAKGDTDCPIWGELEAIFSGPPLNHIILIDDARSFTGESDYPSIESLKEWIQSRNSGYQLRVENDIIQFYI